MNRVPAVAGRFYPGRPDELRHVVSGFLTAGAEKVAALGMVVPHAGYVYSGAIAGQTFGRVAVPRRVLLLGPNHHGVGAPAAVYSHGSWQTPLGSLAIDSALAQELLDTCPQLAADSVAHQFEHSLEVQVPFLQVLAPKCRIVPICLGHLSLTALLTLGAQVGQLMLQHPGEVLVVASSDMTHYESGLQAREKDLRALQHVLDLDPEGLYRTVRDGRISMCGVLPVVVMLRAVIAAGAQRATLVQYGNSGDVTGDQSEVVGYAGILVE